MDYQGEKRKVEHKCRTCLARGKNMKSLLENSHEMKKLLIKFNAVTKVEIPQNSVYPVYICNICQEKVITFYEFQQSYRSSNDLICAYIQNISQKQIKAEDNSMDYSEFVDNTNEMFASRPEAIPISELAEKFSECNSDQNGSDILDNANFESRSDLNDIHESDMVEGESFESNNDVYKNDISQDGNNLETKNDLNNSNEPKYANVDVESASSKINEGPRIKTRKGLHKCRFCHFQGDISHKTRTYFCVHNRGKPCVCNICGKAFLGPVALTRHKRIHCCKIFDCKICGRRCSSRKQLTIHIKEHTVDYQTEATNSDNHSTTNISGFTSTNAEINVMELNLKDQIETYERSLKIESDSTILQLTRPSKKRVVKKYPRKLIDNAVIMVKMKYLHVNCIYCQYVGRSKRQLITHMINYHRKFMTTWCSSCNQVFDDIEKHKNPAYFQHFECPLCKLMCNKFSSFIFHVNFHLDEKRFYCDICGARYQTFDALKWHTLRKHPGHSKSTDGTSEITNSENNDVVSNPIENKPNIEIAEIGITFSQYNEDAIPGIEAGQCKPSCSNAATNKMGECIAVNTVDYQTEAKDYESHSGTNISRLINTNADIDVMKLNLKDQIETYERSVKIEDRSTILQSTRLPKKKVVKKYPREVIDNAVIIVKRKYVHINCIYCQYIGGDKRQLVNHMIHYHRKFLTSWCASCNQVFDDIEKHKNPVYYQHYECPLCKYMCNKFSSLIHHLNFHIDEKRFYCDICGTRYQAFHSLREHTLRKHASHSKSTDGTFEIANSENSDVVSNDPIENKPNIGIAEIGISCYQYNEDAIPGLEGEQCKPSCSNATTNRMGELITVNTHNYLTEAKNLEGHSATNISELINTNAENNVMELDLKDEIEIYEHSVKIEEKSTILQPTRLPKNRAVKKYSKEVIDSAIIKVTKKYLRLNCIYCQFFGVSKRDLVSHMADLHRKFMKNWCSFCNQVFDDLEKHKDHNKFECPLCTHICNRRSALISHLNLHLDEKRFKCDFCGMRFQIKQSLYSHKKRKHPRSCSQSNEATIPGIDEGQCKPSCSSVTSNKMEECITVNTESMKTINGLI